MNRQSFQFFIFTLLLAVSLKVKAQPFTSATEPDRTGWTMAQFWEETQIKFETTLQGVINDKTCLRSLKYFLGCTNSLVRVYNYALSKKEQAKKVYFLYPDYGIGGELPGFRVDEIEFNDETFEQQYGDYQQNLKKWYEEYRLLANRFPSPIWIFPFSQAYSSFAKKYVTDKETEGYMTALAVNVYLSSAYDPHTYILPIKYREQSSQASVRTGGQKGKFGINFLKVKYADEDYFVIKKLEKNSPVIDSGLSVGDVLLSANGKEGTEDIAAEIMNQDIDTVELKVIGSQGKKTVSIHRALFGVDNVESQMLTTLKGKSVAYLRLKSFSSDEACQSVIDQGVELLKEGATSLILDLRDNGGGLVEQALCINWVFLEVGSKLFGQQSLDSDGQSIGDIRYAYSNDKYPNVFHKVPTVVLVDGGSASASEIVAIYLQAYEKAFIVGERTFGKGTMQQVRSQASKDPLIASLAGNKMVVSGQTVARFYGPQGVSPQIQGVVPEIEAYPYFKQTEPTEFEREADSYENALTVDAVTPVFRKKRLKQVVSVKKCLTKNDYAKKSYEAIDEFQQLIYDNQLGVALASLECSIDLGLKPYESTEILMAVED